MGGGELNGGQRCLRMSSYAIAAQLRLTVRTTTSLIPAAVAGPLQSDRSLHRRELFSGSKLAGVSDGGWMFRSSVWVGSWKDDRSLGPLTRRLLTPLRTLLDARLPGPSACARTDILNAPSAGRSGQGTPSDGTVGCAWSRLRGWV